MSKYHIVGNHMSRLNIMYYNVFFREQKGWFSSYSDCGCSCLYIKENTIPLYLHILVKKRFPIPFIIVSVRNAIAHVHTDFYIQIAHNYSHLDIEQMLLKIPEQQ